MTMGHAAFSFVTTSSQPLQHADRVFSQSEPWLQQAKHTAACGTGPSTDLLGCKAVCEAPTGSLCLLPSVSAPLRIRDQQDGLFLPYIV